MEIESLRTYVDLCDFGSFTRTAQRRSITQSAVSQRLRTLEAELGVVLLDRAKGRRLLHPTAAGKVVLEAARTILECADRLALDLEPHSPGRPSGTLRVATVYSLGLHSLSEATARFLEEFPEVRLHVEYLRTDRIYEALAAGAVDCGVVACPAERPGTTVWRFSDEPMVAVVGARHPLSRFDVVAPSALSEFAMAAFDPAVPTRALVDAWLEESGVVQRSDGDYDNVETIKQLVGLGGHYAILPEPSVRAEVASGRLKEVRMDARRLGRPIGMILETRSANRRVLRCLRDVLTDCMGEPSAEGDAEMGIIATK